MRTFTPEPRTDLEAALVIASRRERETERRQFVIFDGSLEPPRYVVEERMPGVGLEWYTADGIRHG